MTRDGFFIPCDMGHADLCYVHANAEEDADVKKNINFAEILQKVIFFIP